VEQGSSPQSSTRWLLVYEADVSIPGWANFYSSRNCAAVVLHTVRSGDTAKVARSGITNYLHSWWNGSGPPHDFLIGNTLEGGRGVVVRISV